MRLEFSPSRKMVQRKHIALFISSINGSPGTPEGTQFILAALRYNWTIQMLDSTTFSILHNELSQRFARAMSIKLPSVHILSLAVHDVNMETALSVIESFIQSRGSHHVVTADASMFVMANEDPALYSIVSKADLVTPDGFGILWAAKRQGTPLRERVSGVDIVENLCALSANRGYRIFFLGAGPGVAEQAAGRMRDRYSGTNIVGTRDGFFAESDTSSILEIIRQSKPDIVCVAMGIPRQEKWIEANRNMLDVPILIGVGGTLDVLSGNTRRAPIWMQNMALEWLWRVLHNPRKITKVMLLPRFVTMIRRAQ